MKTKEEKKARQAAYRAANREKLKAKGVAYHAANREKLNAYHAAYHAANPEKSRARKRRSQYGISPEAFQLMRLMQKNTCGICKEVFSETPNVDHCHETGEVRGLLCTPCNKGLGFLKDSLEILESAKGYLRDFTKPDA